MGKRIISIIAISLICISDIIGQKYTFQQIPYSNIAHYSTDYRPSYFNGDIESPPVSYYRVNVISFGIGREKKWWKKYAPVLHIVIDNGELNFTKVVSGFDVSENGDYKRYLTVTHEQITDFIPYNGKSFKI